MTLSCLPWHKSLLTTLCGCLLGWCSVTSAQSPRILVVTEPGLPAPLEQSVVRSFAAIGEVANPADYFKAARAQRLDPSSEAALSRIAPKTARARLIAAVASKRGKLEIVYRNGDTGAVISKQKLSARGRSPELSVKASRKLTAAARRALARAGGAGGGSHQVEEEDDDDDELAPQPSAAAATRPVAPQPGPRRPVPVNTAGPAPVAAAEPATETEQPAEDAAEAAPASSADDTGLSVRLSLGTGAGMREVYVPRRFDGQEFSSGLAIPALEVGLGVQGMISSQWLLAAEAYYRTVFGMEAQSGANFRKSASTHSILAGGSLGYRFGGPGSTEFRLLAGWMFRMLTPDNDALPSARIYGPVLRPALIFKLVEGLTLRIAPEVIVVLGPQATQRGASITGLGAVGIGVGGELVLELHIGGPMYLGLEYRESYVFASSSYDTNFSDLERLIIARGILQL